MQTLQPSGGDKENLVGTGRGRDKKYEFVFFSIYRQLASRLFVCHFSSDPKVLKSHGLTEVEVKSKENKSVIAKINPSLYKKLIIEDLTSTGVYIYCLVVYVANKTIDILKPRSAAVKCILFALFLMFYH